MQELKQLDMEKKKEREAHAQLQAHSKEQRKRFYDEFVKKAADNNMLLPEDFDNLDLSNLIDYDNA